ncbi:MAG: efflux RND transporter permease subunit, partial [Bifidobacteriaceae bacterium]|nr:efflux RND transporter permease subunit [Bifidobacteriaceae bacterium]
MSRLTELSIRNRAVTALLTLAIVAGGYFALNGLKLEMIPSVEMPMAMVSAKYEGVSAEQVEKQLAEPVEGAIELAPGVESVSTTSVDSALYSVAQFRYGTDLNAANEKLSTALNRILPLLPDEVEINVLTGSMEDLPVINMAVRGDDTAALDNLVNGVLAPRLSRLENVRTVSVSGFIPDEIVIKPRTEDLTAHRVTIEQIKSVLVNNGVAIPAGQVVQNDMSLNVQAGQAIASLEELKELRITPTPVSPAPSATGQLGLGDGTGQAVPGAGAAEQAVPSPVEPVPKVTLGEVADVERQPEAAKTIARLNGETAVSLQVTKIPEGNSVAVSQSIHQVLDSLQETFDKAGLDTGIVFDQAPFIEDSVSGLVEEGILGLIFAVLVILLFLRSPRATLVSAVSIPLSLLMTLIAMSWTGQTLNILTLAAITVAVGRVVDDSIVVTENIKRHLSYGAPKQTAILRGVKEVAVAVASSTLCTVAVFIPLVFVGGIAGEMFRPFGLTVAIALLASLLVALTIVPVLAYWFVQAPLPDQKVEQEQQQILAEQRERRGFWQRLYLPLLRKSLLHPVITLIVALAMVGLTGVLVPRLETNFLGNVGGNTLTVNQYFRAGTSLEVEDEQARKTEAAMAEVDGVGNIMSRVGPAGVTAFGFSTQPLAVYYVTLERGSDTSVLVDKVRRQVIESSGEAVAQSSVSPSEAAILMATTVEIVVRAPDQESLTTATDQVRKAAQAVPGAIDVVDNLSEDQSRVQVTMDRDKVAEYGLTETQTAVMLQGLMEPARIGTLEDPETGDVPVLLSLGDPAHDVDELKQIPVLNTPDGDVLLEELAQVEVTRQPVSLSRTDGQRSSTITVTPTNADLGSLTGALGEAIAGIDLPSGVSVDIGGASADMGEAFTDLIAGIVIAVLMVFILMVGTFGSMVQPFLLLVSVPLAATGALAALLLTDTPLGVAAFIGMLLLVGVVVANAIVLIDLINQYRASGMKLAWAIEEGARKRLRPILMTAGATVFALTPMAIGLTGGGGAFISQPLALVVIGGLVTSTFLTLVVVPVLYQIEVKTRQRFQARRQARAEVR